MGPLRAPQIKVHGTGALRAPQTQVRLFQLSKKFPGDGVRGRGRAPRRIRRGSTPNSPLTPQAPWIGERLYGAWPCFGGQALSEKWFAYFLT